MCLGRSLTRRGASAALTRHRPWGSTSTASRANSLACRAPNAVQESLASERVTSQSILVTFRRIFNRVGAFIYMASVARLHRRSAGTQRRRALGYVTRAAPRTPVDADYIGCGYSLQAVFACDVYATCRPDSGQWPHGNRTTCTADTRHSSYTPSNSKHTTSIAATQHIHGIYTTNMTSTEATHQPHQPHDINNNHT